jgi:hypothetical protein
MHEITIEELKNGNTIFVKKFGTDMTVAEITKLPNKSYEITFENGDTMICKPRTKLELHVGSN